MVLVCAAATVLDEGKEVIMLEKFAAIGGNTIRTGGQVNAAEPKWQSAFPALAGEKDTLIQLLNHDEKDIDEAYLEDFNTLKRQIKDYLEKVAIKMIIFSILLNYIAFKRI